MIGFTGALKIYLALEPQDIRKPCSCCSMGWTCGERSCARGMSGTRNSRRRHF